MQAKLKENNRQVRHSEMLLWLKMSARYLKSSNLRTVPTN